MIYDGYTKVRNGILEHLQSGKITPLDCTMYFVILTQLDFETGVWFGSAFRLVDAINGACSVHVARGFLRKFVRMGWLKSWKNQTRTKTVTTYLVDKYEPTAGPHKGKRVNAYLTTDWKSPVFLDTQSGCSQVASDPQSENKNNEKVPPLNIKTEDLKPKTVRVSEEELVEDI